MWACLTIVNFFVARIYSCDDVVMSILSQSYICRSHYLPFRVVSQGCIKGTLRWLLFKPFIYPKNHNIYIVVMVSLRINDSLICVRCSTFLKSEKYLKKASLTLFMISGNYVNLSKSLQVARAMSGQKDASSHIAVQILIMEVVKMCKYHGSKYMTQDKHCLKCEKIWGDRYE